LRIARETDVAGHIRAMGLRLREGLASLANEHGIAIRQSGPPQMPLMLFEGRYARAGRFARPRYATARSFIPSTICSCPRRIAQPISTRRCRRPRTASRPSVNWKRDPIDKSLVSTGADLGLRASIKMPRNAVFTTSDSGAVFGENGEIAE
jgi:hypothetical protein